MVGKRKEDEEKQKWMSTMRSSSETRKIWWKVVLLLFLLYKTANSEAIAQIVSAPCLRYWLSRNGGQRTLVQPQLLPPCKLEKSFPLSRLVSLSVGKEK